MTEPRPAQTPGAAAFGARLRRLQRRLQPRALLLTADTLWDAAEGKSHDGFGAWCRAHAGQACELWVGAALLSDLVCEPGLPLRVPAARAAWARRVLQHYHGEAAAAWPLLPWRHRSALGACALRGPVLAEWQAQAAEHGVRLVAVRPLWPALLDRLLAQRPSLRRAAAGQAWLVEAGPEQAQVTRIALANGGLTAVSRRRLQAPWPAALQGLLDATPAAADTTNALLWLGPAPEGTLPVEVALSLPTPGSDALPRVGGQGPDFLRPEPRPGLLAWAWLATAVLVLAGAGWEAREAWALQAQVETLAVPRVAARPVPPVPAADPAEAELTQRLQHPWQAVFLASETPAAHLRWQVLDHTAGGELRLQGLADDPAPVQRVAASLRRQAVWQQVLVSRLETQPEGQSFEIVARMATTAP